MDQKRPTREEWIALRVEAAMAHLMQVPVCPECGHMEYDDTVISRVAYGYMETRVTRCEHPWHLVPLCEGVPWLMAIGLPNRPDIDAKIIRDMQGRVLAFALKEKLLPIEA